MKENAGELRPDEIEKLSHFLHNGLGGEGPDLGFSAPVMLQWKYFGRTEDRGIQSFVWRNEQEAICAHCGISYVDFSFPGHAHTYKAVHAFDWLSNIPFGGIRLLRKELKKQDILYGAGGTQDAQRSLKGLGCEKLLEIPIYRKFLTVSSCYKQAMLWNDGSFRKALRFARNLNRMMHMPHKKRHQIELQQIEHFEQADLEGAMEAGYIHSVMTVERLNHMLAHPLKKIFAYRMLYKEKPCGYAVLSLTKGKLSTGRILYCQLKKDSLELIEDTFHALSDHLQSMGAEMLVSKTSHKLWISALKANNFHQYGASPFWFKSYVELEHDGNFFITSMEADSAF